MNESGHISVDRVRAYLLGQLEADEADRLEDSYFCERSIFLRVQSIEDGLIRDYLRGKLSASDLTAFEARYLESPELKLRLEEVRRLEEADRSKGSVVNPFWKTVLAGALACTLGVVLWQSFFSKPVVWPLVPGVTMGPTSGSTTFLLPNSPASIRLILPLPGHAVSVRCSARVSQVVADGTWKQIWISQPQSSEAVAGVQQAVFLLDSQLLAEQDYVVEAMGEDQQVLESYVFSVRRAVR